MSFDEWHVLAQAADGTSEELSKFTLELHKSCGMAKILGLGANGSGCTSGTEVPL